MLGEGHKLENCNRLLRLPLSIKIKQTNKQHEQFSIDFTELAIIQRLQKITPAILCGFFNLKISFSTAS